MRKRTIIFQASDSEPMGSPAGNIKIVKAELG